MNETPKAPDPLRNPKDPLNKTGPEAERVLFSEMGKLSSGFPNEVVIRASANMILNALRQAHPHRSGAEKAYDELSARVKHVLLEQHYDNLGKRRNIFPYDQHIVMPFWKADTKFF